MSEEQARHFAEDWLASWNTHDLRRILEHYEDYVTLTSPVAVGIPGDPTGTICGKIALRSYFAGTLTAFPDLRFELNDVMWGVNSIVLYYIDQRGLAAGAFMEISPEGRVSRVVINHRS
jgi:ketosteroid isomerase-like protein